MIKRRIFLAIFALASSLIPLTSSFYSAKAQETQEEKVQLMFVQTAEDLKIDDKTQTLRLVNVNQQTLYNSLAGR